jgi:ribose 1,5-bisphosphokinase PhnN
VLAAVRRRLRSDAASAVEFPTRVSTKRRNPDAGAIGITRRVFADMCHEGSFLLHWTDEAGSHGVPIDVRAALERGATVVVAAPPSAIADARDAWPDVRVISVTGHTDQARRTLTARACFDRTIRLPQVHAKPENAPAVAVHCGAHISPAIDGLTRALLAQLPAVPAN